MSSALQTQRDRLEATPRDLDDDELVRIARGDRGCLGDLISGIGAIALVSGAILGAMGKISFNWAYLACAVWIGGFVWGTWTQARSGKQRKAALESGPLVMAVVLRRESWLVRPGRRVGRAVVAFTTAPELRFDRAHLDALAAALEAASERAGASEWSALLTDDDAFGLHHVELSGAPAADAHIHIATMIVHPERLEGGYLGYAEDQEAGEKDLDLDAPTRAPIVLAIVDPETSFIEHAPAGAAAEPEPEPEP